MALTPAAAATTTAHRLRQQAELHAAVLPPLLVEAMRVATTVAQGVHGRRRVGQGETFWQFRPYAFGDMSQHIDWRRSARTDDLFVRELEWEAAQSVWLWCDASASMAYRSDAAPTLKSERVALLAIALMALLVRGGERIALLDRPGLPSTGRAALNRLAETILRTASAGTDDADDVPPCPDLPRHGTVVLMSDFLAPWPAFDGAIRALAARGARGHMVQILDPSEATMPFRGRSRFQGLQAEGELLVGRAEALRDDYLERLAEQQARLRELARRIDWTFAVHRTDQPVQTALMALYLALAEPHGA